MLEQSIESRRVVALPALLWLVPAIGLVIVGLLASKYQFAVASVPFWLCAFFWRWPGEAPFQAFFSKTALEVSDPPIQVPYEEMQALIAGRRPANPYKAGPASYPITIVHSNGVVRIPADLNAPSDEVYAFLYNRFQSNGTPPVDPQLTRYLAHQQKLFGAERVWSYRARKYLGRRARSRGWQVLFLSLFLGALGWIGFGAMGPSMGWIDKVDQASWFGVGFSVGIVGLVATALTILSGTFFLFSSPAGRTLEMPAKLRAAGLVVSPEGIALAQADLTGQMRWNEVRDLKFVRRAARVIGGLGGHGIILHVAGAAIIVADIYDRPLPLIHQLMLHYWSADRKGEEPDQSWHFDPHRLLEPDMDQGIRARPGRTE
jgi:hypothetical protein